MIAKHAVKLVMAVGLLLAAYSYGSYLEDEAKLRETAARVAEDRPTAAEKTLALLQWVHEIGETKENNRYFLWPRLRATPLQVLESGGDCADKSRLLTALLRQVDVPSTMVMCFDPATRSPTHTVVAATLEDGSNMIVDPAYGLYFPLAEPGRYAGLTELRARPQILDERLAVHRAELPRFHPVHAYNAATAGYSLAGSFNWNRDRVTRALHSVLHPAWGDELYAAPRPRFVEEPKVAIAFAATAFSLCILLIQAMARRVHRIRAACVPTRDRRPGPGSVLTVKSLPTRAVGV